MHGHSHGGGDHKADKWTNLNTGIMWLWGFCNDAFWLGGLLDSAIGLEEDILGLSFYGIGVGAAVALLSSYGDAYCHRIININNQGEGESASRSQCQTCAPTNAEMPIDIHVNIKDESSADMLKSLVPKPSLSFWQKAALVGDAVSHVGTTSGGLTSLVYAVAGKQQKMAVQGVATFFGMISSVAAVRACKNAMREYNDKHFSR